MKNSILISTYFRIITTAYYVKLQDAFVAEAGAIGSWGKIGYSLNASSNFQYTDPTGFIKDETTNIDVLGTAGAIHWQGDNNAKLNDCAMHSKWQVKVKAAGTASQGMVEYDAGVDGEGLGKNTATTGACLSLTPNFVKIGG